MPPSFPFGNSAYTTWKNAYNQLEVVTSTGDHFVEQPDTSLPEEGNWYYHFQKDELYRVAWQNNGTIGYVDDIDNTTHEAELGHWETLLNNDLLFPVALADTDNPPQ